MADERYEWYKSHGICVDCGANEAYRGHTRCLECRFKGIEKTQKWQEKNREHHKEYQKAYQRNLRQYRRDNGLCQQCGKPSGGKAFCPPHAAIRRQRKENKRRESGTLPRDLMGKGEYCYFCGEKVTVKGDKTCPKCHEREAKWAEKMRKRIDYKNLYWRKLDNAFWNERKAKFKLKEELSP